MSEQSQDRRTSRLPVYFVIGLLIVFSLVFVIAFVTLSESSEGEAVQTPQADSYLDAVTPLLVDADPQRGAELVEHHACVGCHRSGAANIAPPFVGIAERVAERRPPLSAEAYLYESIEYPTAYVVEGYSASMPQNYGRILSERDLGDIIAYLLSPEAQ